ncbi:MAG: excinuclease ABC subunit C [Sphingobacteriales bacterium BACL12 MAG-120813-bin55]|jgi:excinuclease ABC subunit C|nr:MAG: excinuclease ABC subunit C [Sphingobacteriales bacterium BACL12 MAG-120813-bin55]
MTPEAFKAMELTLPAKPGVYRYYDETGQLLYVGKAKHLRKRVSSYFNKNDQGARIRMLVRKIERIEFTITNSEQDALLLENTLIKEHQPKYNVNLKDGKTYPYICVKKERFPRIFFTRRKINDGSTYLGPYPSLGKVRSIFDFIKSLYPIRTCSYNLSPSNIAAGKFKVCLEYHLGNCKGPCEGLQDEADYMESVQQIIHILKGNMGVVKQHFKQQLQDHIAELAFEKAEQVRIKLEAIDAFTGRSTVVNVKIDNVDVFAYAENKYESVIGYLQVGQGMIIRSKTIVLQKKLDETKEELLLIGIQTLQKEMESETAEIIIPFETELPEHISYTIPQAGDKKKLLDLAWKNAAYLLEERNAGRDKREEKNANLRVLDQIKEDFRLQERPHHIECFDNSNIQGSSPVASCVVFRNARPSKKDYRHFNIKTVEGPDDFSSMKEIVGRRYKRIQEEGASLPQLIVIDGGKGQLGAAVEALKEVGVYGKIAICSIAKRLEEIYFPEDPLPLHISKKSESLRIIQQLRDEAHRFAITFHRQQRSKKSIQSSLDGIAGIGPATRQLLLKTFKSVTGIREAGEEAVAAVVGPAKAKALFSHWEKQPEE